MAPIQLPNPSKPFPIHDHFRTVYYWDEQNKTNFIFVIDTILGIIKYNIDNQSVVEHYKPPIQMVVNNLSTKPCCLNPKNKSSVNII